VGQAPDPPGTLEEARGFVGRSVRKNFPEYGEFEVSPPPAPARPCPPP